MTMRNHLLGLALAASMAATAHAQQVDCSVQVNFEAVPSTNKDLLRDFASDVKTYVGGFNWGGGNPDEKVKCTINIFIQSVIGENRYSAQVFIGSQRPIYQSPQSTAVVRLLDEIWEFTYVRTTPLNHHPHSYDDLTSFLDFYMYLVVAYDNDTYERLSGTSLFQKALDVARLGQSSGQKGWQPSTTTFARVQLIGELLNPAFEAVRIASWTYHFCGLDSLALNKPRAFGNMIEAVKSIGALRKKVDSRNLIIKTFFEAKAKELAEVFLDYPDVTVYGVLNDADPTHTKTYEEALQQRK
jgi:hypothetical protein